MYRKIFFKVVKKYRTELLELVKVLLCSDCPLNVSSAYSVGDFYSHFLTIDLLSCCNFFSRFDVDICLLLCLLSCVIVAAVGELEACKLQHLATIEDLRGELVAVKQRSAELEKSKQSMEADQHLKSSEHALKLQSLQKVHSSYCIKM